MSKEKVRVYQLAREMGVESKGLIDLLKAAGADVKNHMTTLDAQTRQLAHDLISGKVKPQIPKPATQSAGVPPKRDASVEQSIPAPRAKRPGVIPGPRKPTVETEAQQDDEVVVGDEGLVEDEGMIEEMVPAAEQTPEQPSHGADVESAATEEAPAATESASQAGGPATPIPIPTTSKMKQIPDTVSEGSGESRGSRPPRERRASRPRTVVAAPPPGSAPSAAEPPKKRAEPAQKPVMKLTPDALRAGQVPLPGGAAKRGQPTAEGDDFDRGEGKGRAARGGAALAGRGERQRRRGQRAAERRQLQVPEFDDDEQSPRRTQRGRGKRPVRRQVALAERPIELESPITVRTFSAATGIKTNDILSKLWSLDIMATINASMTEEEAELLGEEFELQLRFKQPRTADSLLQESLSASMDTPEDLVLRPPVVTFMGHVDHGKTSLMDRIRSAAVAAGESGGITQHIGAYQVKVDGGVGAVTFLDTPGHEAFTAMRARGANVTDVVVLVVAADDGVMPQTEEAINHAKAADVPIVVALNKIDLPGTNPDRVKQQLSTHGLVADEWGGDTLVVPTSAETGEGIDELLKAISLIAELKELQGNPDRPAQGMCIEASLSEGRGVQTTVLIRNGTLRQGDVLLCGSAYGRVRAMFDDHNRPIGHAGPSTPVCLTGLDNVPDAGEPFFVIDDLSKAREICEERVAQRRTESQSGRQHVTLERLFDSIQQQEAKELLLVIKADVRGSLEAIRNEIDRFEHDEVRVRVIHDGVGGISESDVLLADASDAIVIGFHVAADDRAQSLASEKGVEIRRYEVIYKVTDDIRLALEGMLTPESREVDLGRALVQELFTISRSGTIAGCRVVRGTVERNSRIRVIREGTVVGCYPLESLRRVKDDAKEVREGFECGIKLSGFNDVKRGDLLEAFKIEEVKRKLET